MTFLILCISLSVLGLICGIYFWCRQNNAQKNREKVLAVIDCLMQTQVEYITKDKDQRVQLEIAKYIQDFLLCELKESRFTPNGIKFADHQLIEHIPDLMKYYNYPPGYADGETGRS